MILVSACLAGINCNYKGGNCIRERIVQLVKEGRALPVCPEQLGGCTTPRPAVEIIDGTGADVIDRVSRACRKNGEDVSDHLILGAEETLAIAKMAGVSQAVLRARSPSCGCGEIYDGTFSGIRIQGNGVTAEILLRNGIEVFTDENMPDSI